MTILKRIFLTRLSIIVTGISILAAVGIVTTTTAFFMQSISAESALSGKILIAQGPTVDDRFSDEAFPKVIADISDPTQVSVATLLVPPIGDPIVETVTFSTKLQTLDGSALASLALTLHAPDPSDAVSHEILPYVLFGIYVDGRSVLPQATPLSASEVNALNGGGGVALSQLDADGEREVTVTIKMWLRDDAPKSAYSQPITVNLSFVGTTVAGNPFIVDTEF
ncbi:hypothetical protein [Lysinibacter sp. HNR]|uniref:hypothetical protein n=1 Tax=Lysinibacter sp. HNR TaxID=3031408 RepID=UPI002434DA9F|nr:hypothetical protein [Lysinibacter sp. HNR]WGD37211.1 hypothetical protein FrondiHNR_12380 [Lysinibacter sp. HNR]